MDELVTSTVSDRVARITLNRPEKRNSLSLALRMQLVEALRAAERDDAVSVVLLSGAGPSFCAGYDLADDRARKPAAWLESEHFDSWSDQFARSVERDWMVVWELLKPVVVKVHGYCLAGGAELMSMCDIAFVADDAVIGYPPMRSQSTPDTVIFPWKMTMAQAKYLQLTGNSVSGREAAAMGWVAKSFPAGELDAQVESELRALASIDPALLAANKASVNQAYEIMGMRTHLHYGWQWHTLSTATRARAGDFGRTSRAMGLKAALEERDEPFRKEGFVP